MRTTDLKYENISSSILARMAVYIGIKHATNVLRQFVKRQYVASLLSFSNHVISKHSQPFLHFVLLTTS